MFIGNELNQLFVFLEYLNTKIMKKLLLILWLTAGISSFSFAQISLVPASMAKQLPGEWAVVKDSTGKQYSYDDWTRMMASRKYNLKSRT
jgi:hypothetical protein